MIFELRQYRMLPGQEQNWVNYMDEVIIPGQTAAGATILGSFVGIEEPDLYVWLRRFDDEEQKTTFYKTYYETEEWLTVNRPKVREMIDPSRSVITLLSANPLSGIQ